ncbi:YbjQ family protein [Flavobacterium sp. KACC 22761]|uniref:YbjQ family protein n=1 Tax=Flavobacterium sp. KACC 22761 TaxID=3092665 RepID=UPI002A749FFC|nr:YbjQ family protein [Flavobacterium sp. KACC 22761]WPO77074.1 YbjQ family protein [Flavobacterium sp. KACC 22761]
MANPKDILVITTSSADGLKIKKHLKPVSAHIVAGTNLFSDFLGGLTDVFGGRSSSYQKQLSSLYNEAIERIKYNAHEIGGNCVIGLNIDMDEISGKGKSMFMLTAIGTAVIIEKDEKLNSLSNTNEKFENVGVERINNLRQRKNIIERAENGELDYDDEIWSFITSNQVQEIFPFILKRYTHLIENFQSMPDSYNVFHKNFTSYIDALEETQRVSLLYDKIETETNQQVALYLSKVIKELNLFDYEKNMSLLRNSDFKKQKIGLRIATYDKSFYDKNDIENFNQTKNFIHSTFKERGEITTKKQLLSSKEKDVWNCECGNKSVEIGEYCGSCNNNIFGFKESEMKPTEIVKYIDQKIELINEYIK